ncbi:MAG: TrbC/VirB2 family protein [Minisyncoccota bacterium]
MDIKKYFTYLTVLVFVLMASVSMVSAQGSGPSNTGGSGPSNTGGSGPSAPTSNIKSTLDNPFGNNQLTITELFQTIIKNIIIPIGAVLAILAFIYAGFLYVTAAGNEKTIEKAHKALLYAAVGTAILLGASVIAEVIRATVNQLQQ